MMVKTRAEVHVGAEPTLQPLMGKHAIFLQKEHVGLDVAAC